MNSTTAAVGSVTPRRRQQRFTHNFWLAAFLILELACLGAFVPGYLRVAVLLDASRTFIEGGVLALGMTFVIISGGIDLSVAALLALVSVVMGIAFRAGVPMPAAMLLGFATGVAGGLLNGAAIAYLRLHPFVVTLATMAIFRGGAYAISNAAAIANFPAWFTAIGQSYLLGGLVPAQLFLLLIVVALCWITLRFTAFGRRVYGVGANELAARFSGVAVERVKLQVYALMGALVAVAAIIQTARVSTARANAAVGLELPVIAMAVLGGARVTGGAGSIGGTMLGVLVLAYLQDGLISAGVRNDWGLVVVGLFLVLGVLVSERMRSAPRR